MAGTVSLFPSIKQYEYTNHFRHMARDEMETITEDKWDDEIWGVESVKSDSKRETPKLILYFGQNVGVWSR